MNRAARPLVVAVVAIVLTGAGCQRAPVSGTTSGSANPAAMSDQTITITTSDGVQLAADVYGKGGNGPQALLLHMMPATKESWRPFVPLLLDRGFVRVLAIDLRGHGGSTKGPNGTTLDYTTFTDGQHQESKLDVEAAMRWLADHGADPARTAVVGASIGANLAVRYGADHPLVPAVAALSPGLDYRGITTADAVARYGQGRALYIAASEEDTQSSSGLAEWHRLDPDAKIVTLKGAGHGTAMFVHDPAFMAATADWLAANVK